MDIERKKKYWYIILYVNGHLALENVIAAMKLPEGSEVITTPFTFASTTHAIVRNGLKPVFCDIKTPVAKYMANRVLTLPLYADLSIEDVDRICDIILK